MLGNPRRGATAQKKNEMLKNVDGPQLFRSFLEPNHRKSISFLKKMVDGRRWGTGVGGQTDTELTGSELPAGRVGE